MLCVDDEPLILDGLRDVLGRSYDVRVAEGGEQALELLEQDPDGFAVVISDMRMPGMSGASFLREARRVAPLAVRMLLTGHADATAAVRAVNDGQIFRFLTKPCDRDELHRACTDALAQHRVMSADRVLVEQAMDGSIRALADALAVTAGAMSARGADPGTGGPRDDRGSADGPAGASPHEHEPTMTLGEAADALELSTSTLRRWADAGRIHAIRTSGGHRRFPAREVQRLRSDRPAGHKPVVRSVPAPVESLPALSALLTSAAADVARTATNALYDPARPGWFASPAGRDRVERWAFGVAAGARTGDYEATAGATRALIRDASWAGASLLERFTLVERIGDVILRELQSRGTADPELLGARRLLLRFRRLVLESDDTIA